MLVVVVAATHNNLKIEENNTMKRLMSITITLLFVFALVFAAQVAETQAQPHMDDDHMADSPWDDDHMNDSPWDDDDHMADSPWDDDDHMNDSPWDDDDHMNDSPWDDDHMADSPQYNMPAMFWMYFWMLYMLLFMGPVM
jgi:hypothetical protein